MSIANSQVQTFDRRWGRLGAAAVMLGSFFLIVQYLWRQSYWGDEVSILTNIGRMSIAGFFQSGLTHSQAAPPLFLTCQKLMWNAFGSGEYSQRFLPMMMGVLAMFAFAGLCRRLLPPGAAVFALVLFCFSDKFIWHATEVKQYAGDVLCAILLIWLALDALEQREGLSRFVMLSIFAALAIWISHTVIFVYDAASLVILFTLSKADRRRALLYAACNALFLVSFAALYCFSIRHQRSDAFLLDFWRDSFADWSHPLGIPFWLGNQLYSVCGYVVSPTTWIEIPLCGFIALGLAAWIRQRRWEMIGLCFGPLVLVILAAGAGQYPLSGARVDFFLVPGLLIAAGRGYSALAESLPASRKRLALLAFPIFLIPLLVLDVSALFLPRVRTNILPVARYLQSRSGLTDPIYAPYISTVLNWYLPHNPGPVIDQMPPTDPAANPTASSRFWYVAAERPENLLRHENANLDLIRLHATEITADRFTVRGGAAFHFEEIPPPK